jgi:hypothetical protein
LARGIGQGIAFYNGQLYGLTAIPEILVTFEIDVKATPATPISPYRKT